MECIFSLKSGKIDGDDWVIGGDIKFGPKNPKNKTGYTMNGRHHHREQHPYSQPKYGILTKEEWEMVINFRECQIKELKEEFR